MLHMYCLQPWYGLADEALEDALYDSQALRDFVGIDLSREAVPDATTLLKFRRLLLANDLTKALFEEINARALLSKAFVRCALALAISRSSGSLMTCPSNACFAVSRQRHIGERALRKPAGDYGTGRHNRSVAKRG